MKINEHHPLAHYVGIWKTVPTRRTPWQELVRTCEPIPSGCGTVYECVGDNPNESIAIVDMRAIPYTEPHSHPPDIMEIYFLLQGSAIIYAGL